MIIIKKKNTFEKLNDQISDLPDVKEAFLPVEPQPFTTILDLSNLKALFAEENFIVAQTTQCKAFE